MHTSKCQTCCDLKPVERWDWRYPLNGTTLESGATHSPQRRAENSLGDTSLPQPYNPLTSQTTRHALSTLAKTHPISIAILLLFVWSLAHRISAFCLINTMSGFNSAAKGGRGRNSYPAKQRGFFEKGVWKCDCNPRLSAIHLQTKKAGANKGRWCKS
jgi:hypothetical protein